MSARAFYFMIFDLHPLKTRSLLPQTPSPIKEELKSFPRFHAQELAFEAELPPDYVGLSLCKP